MLYRDFNPESNNSLYIFPSISIEQYFPLIEGTPRPDYCDARLLLLISVMPLQTCLYGPALIIGPVLAQCWHTQVCLRGVYSQNGKTDPQFLVTI